MRFLSKICIVLKRFLANCNLHGLRYLVEDHLHWTERIFWMIVCGLCWFGCVIMVNDSLDAFYDRGIAFTMESTYLDWETKFPSISVCVGMDKMSMENAKNISQKKYGNKIISNTNQLKWLYTNAMPKLSATLDRLFSQMTDADVIELYKKSVVNCTSLMTQCTWHTAVKFNCCDEFLPLKTPAGLCYTFNTIHTRSNLSLTKFIMNKNTGAGFLDIGFIHPKDNITLSKVSVYINNNVAIPIVNGDDGRHVFLQKEAESKIVYFTIVDTFNDPGLRYISRARRRCRYPDESEDMYIYNWYSNSACNIQLRVENMLKYCGCIDHTFPYKNGMPICNYTRRKCLINHHIEIMKVEDSLRCLPDCEGMHIRQYQLRDELHSDKWLDNTSHTIRLELLALPMTRYKRYVVRSLLDLVVAVGSTAGLFMGAGILSLIEIPYWLLLRHNS